MPHMKLARRSAQLLLVSAVALAGGMSLAAGTGADPAARRVGGGKQRPD